MAENLDPAAVERGARAGYDASRDAAETEAWDDLPEWGRETFRAFTRAALAAAGQLVTPERDAQASDLPTTEDVRFTYAADREEQTGIRSNEWGRRFDAWLTDRDAQVREQVAQEINAASKTLKYDDDEARVLRIAARIARVEDR